MVQPLRLVIADVKDVCEPPTAEKMSQKAVVVTLGHGFGPALAAVPDFGFHLSEVRMPAEDRWLRTLENDAHLGPAASCSLAAQVQEQTHGPVTGASRRCVRDEVHGRLYLHTRMDLFF